MATWQDKLSTYATDKNAAAAEVLRAKNVYATQQANNDTKGMAASKTWADQVRAAGGLDQNLYGAGVTKEATAANQAKSLQDAITAQAPQITPQAPKAVDNSGLINSSSDSLIAAIKGQIAQATNNKNLTMGGLQAKNDPLRNASEIQRYSEMASSREAAANAGDRGETGRQNTLLVDTAGANRINNINLQQDSEKSSLQNDISNLMLEGNVQEAQVQAQRLQQLIANNTQMDQNNWSRSVDTANMTGVMSNGQQTMQGKESELNNQLTRMNIDTSKLNLAALPQQIKDQATLVAQQISSGKVDAQIGAAQLKELTNYYSTTNKLARMNFDIAKFNYSQLDVTAKQLVDKIADDMANSKISRAQAQSQIDHAGDSAAANAAQLAWAKDPTNPANTKPNTTTTNTVDDFASTINATFVQSPNVNNGYVSSIDTAGIKKYIDGLIQSNVSESITDSLAARYGIK